MIFYKTYPTKIHALHLKCKPEEFVSEWKACNTDRKRDLTHILVLLDPFLKHWKKLLTRTDYPRDIQIATLYRTLDGENYAGIEIVQSWVERAEDLYKELQYLAIELVRGSYFPNAARPIMAEYVFAYLFRSNLKGQIYRDLDIDLVEITDNELILDTEVDPAVPDILLLKHCCQQPWERYLLYLICNGFSTLEIASIVKLPRETFYYEERDLWQQLKSLWQPEEL